MLDETEIQKFLEAISAEAIKSMSTESPIVGYAALLETPEPLPKRTVYPDVLDYDYYCKWLKSDEDTLNDSLAIVTGFHPYNHGNYQYEMVVIKEIVETCFRILPVQYFEMPYFCTDLVRVTPKTLTELAAQAVVWLPNDLEKAYNDTFQTELVYHPASPIPKFFNYWMKQDIWTIEEAVCIILGADPIFITEGRNQFNKKLRATEKPNPLFPAHSIDYDKILEACHRSIEAEILKSSNGSLKPNDMIEWAVNKNFPVHPLLMRLVESDKPLNSSSEKLYLNIIGSLLNTILGESSTGTANSLFNTQGAVIDNMIAHHADKYGISKRSLEAKFAAAKRSINSD